MYSKLLGGAQRMRKNPTDAERIFWDAIKAKSLGVKFRQQHIIGRLIVDFYSVKYKLVIEVDGLIHQTQKEKDYERDAVLKGYGCTILRFTNDDVLTNCNSCLEKIICHLNSKSPSWGI